MDANTTLKTDFRALEEKWEQITDVPESPRSLMDVIKYSLDEPLIDLVVENGALILTLDSIYYETIENVYGVSSYID